MGHEFEYNTTPLGTFIIFPHGQAESLKSPEEGKSGSEERMDDTERRLTDEGRQKSREHMTDFGIGVSSIAKIYSGPRRRHQDAAMATQTSGSDSSEVNSAGDLNVTGLLDYHTAGSSGHKEMWSRGYSENNLLKVLYQESDRMALQEKDPVSFSYSITAGNVAELLLERAKELYGKAKKSANNAKEEKLLNTFATTSKSVADTFMMKAIRVAEGEGRLKQFLEHIPDGNGLGPDDSLKIEIGSCNPKCRLDDLVFHLTYKMTRPTDTGDKQVYTKTLTLYYHHLIQILQRRNKLRNRIFESLGFKKPKAK